MYKTVKEMALRWQVSERTVRNYCATGQIADVKREGKSWLLPESCAMPKQGANKKPPVIGIGQQNFGTIIEKGYFYIDKTELIREWWESGSQVTAVMRPRRFGKTLTVSMLEHFFSKNYAGSSLFKKLKIWKYEKYRQLQGLFPVIFLTFASQKATTITGALKSLRLLIGELYRQHSYLLNSDKLTEEQRHKFREVCYGEKELALDTTVHDLAEMLYLHFGKKVLLFLDEYDTPMQEAYLSGYWPELLAFMRNFYNATFKTNPYLEKAFMTGITRISKESIFSDLNNIELVTTSSDAYATAFGFTEPEVFNALELYGYPDKAKVKEWYDGFTFGKYREIYNPWSITNYLHTGKLQTYWVNTSSNALVNQLIYQGDINLKQKVELLLRGEAIETFVDEQVFFGQLPTDERAIWSLLLATGYLKIVKADYELLYYSLALTNKEVMLMLERMVSGWFASGYHGCNGFVRSLLNNELEDMTDYLQAALLDTVSYFDGANNPESFYHGFVLGLMVELKGSYIVQSNRESGFGRYDIMLEPLDKKQRAYLLEFKVCREAERLHAAAEAAVQQIHKKKYAETLLAKGFTQEQIFCYGLAFCGKQVYISK